MKTSNYSLLLLLFVIFSLSTKAQLSTSQVASNKKQLIGNWYESPKESNGDTLVFRATKYLLTATDSKAFAFSAINFIDNTSFKIEYWRWCTKPYAYTGSYTNVNSQINLDFGAGNCSNSLTILSFEKDFLKVIIKEN